MDPRYMTLKEKVAHFVQLEKDTRDYPYDYYGWGNKAIVPTFLRDYDETHNFIQTADTDELECLVSVLYDFIRKYPVEEIIQLCIDRKNK